MQSLCNSWLTRWRFSIYGFTVTSRIASSVPVILHGASPGNDSPNVDHPLNRWNNSRNDGVQERLLVASNAGFVPITGSPRFSFDLNVRQTASTLSMAPSARTPTTAPSVTSTEPPNLSHGGSTTGSSNFSTSTGMVSNPHGVVQLPDMEDNALAAENGRDAVMPARLYCAFYFLDCNFTSDDEDEWKTHCLSHFRGHSPQTFSSCTLCEWTVSASTGAEAWDRRMNHLALHLAVGHKLTDGKADHKLIRYLWQKRIISDAEHKELKCNYRGHQPRGPYTITQGNLQELRRESMRL